MEFFHHSRQKKYRDPSGAVPAGEHVTLSLSVSDPAYGGRAIPEDISCSLCVISESVGSHETVHGSREHETAGSSELFTVIDEPVRSFDESQEPQIIPMERQRCENGDIMFSAVLRLPETPCLCWYYFRIDLNGSRFFYGNDTDCLGGEGRVFERNPVSYQITVYRPASVPDWYKQAIVYQIFPDRFARDPGWLERQAQAAELCGKNGPGRVVQQDWYDTPYYTRDPQGRVTRWPFFGGSLEGIRLRLLYLKSLGIGALYLNPIFLARSNHKYDTADYTRIDPAFGSEDDLRRLADDARRLNIRLILDGVFNHTGADSVYFNRLGNYPGDGACQGESSPYYSWYSFTDFPNGYDCWWDVEDLPAVNENDPSYQSFICGDVIPRWLSKGASGWRLDVADELPDDFISKLREAVKETDPDALLIGEVWEDASNKISYGRRRAYLLGNELDGTMNYPFRDMLLDYMLGHTAAEDAARRFLSLAENYPPEHLFSALNLIGSHDRARVLTLLGDAPLDLSDAEKERYRLPGDKRDLAIRRLKALALLQFMLPGVPCVYYGDEAGAEGFEDPYNRGTYPWGREDDGLLSHYRVLASLRRQYDFLTDGDLDLSTFGEHVLICRRSSRSSSRENGPRKHMTAIVNRHLFGSVSVELDLPDDCGYILDLFTADELTDDIQNGILSIDMPPLSFRLLYTSDTPPRRTELRRGAGVLCHVSSVPGKSADGHIERFIDFLSDSGQKLWQILPINPVDENGGSPYSGPAVFAGNTSLLGLSLNGEEYADIDPLDYSDFCRREAFWLDDYALYTVLKKRFDGAPWQEWPEAERDRTDLDSWRDKARDELDGIKREQYAFWKRWERIHDYARSKGISIIGDLPVYPNADSADTWAHRECFLLDKNGLPLAGAGVPPDYFNDEGQNWGNPLYDWDAMKADGYRWWYERLARSIRRYDHLRVDHFRSFSAFYAVPHGKTACEGYWLPGPGKDFFEAMTAKLGPLPFIAEDLGFLDAQVRCLLKQTGFPGMLVYQFSADEMGDLTADVAKEKVFYTGTHDNQTLVGWCVSDRRGADAADQATDAHGTDDVKKTAEEIIEKLYKSDASWVITPLQDMLGLGDESRMNTPGTTEGNWRWQYPENRLTSELTERFARLAAASGR